MYIRFYERSQIGVNQGEGSGEKIQAKQRKTPVFYLLDWQKSPSFKIKVKNRSFLKVVIHHPSNYECELPFADFINVVTVLH